MLALAIAGGTGAALGGCGDDPRVAALAPDGAAGMGGHAHALDAGDAAEDGGGAPGDADVAQGRRCFPVGARCGGARYECLCGADRVWDCRGPFAHVPKPPEQPFEFFFGCQQSGIECSRFGPCDPVCSCRDFDWVCTFDEACVVPSCPIVPAVVGTPCPAALGQVCPYQAGNGGVAVCICEPRDPRGPAVWSCSVPPAHAR